MISPKPLVSIMTPAYNAAKTLPFALASLQAQTFSDWECIVVNDGSTDSTELLLRSFHDPRIRHICFNENKGRPYARQAALDIACGQYVAMLDADDWYYPQKLMNQVKLAESNPNAVVIGAGMAIEDTLGNIVGVRGCGDGKPRSMKKYDSVPVTHAPSLIRSDAAKKHSYDLRILHAEDTDFMLKVLMGREYCVCPSVFYAYSEHATITFKKLIKSVLSGIEIHKKYLRNWPISSIKQISLSTIKMFVYAMMFATGNKETLVKKRSKYPTSTQIEEYKMAKETVLLISKAVDMDYRKPAKRG